MIALRTTAAVVAALGNPADPDTTAVAVAVVVVAVAVAVGTA